MLAASHLLPEVGGGDLVRREVFGDVVDANCLSHEDYAQLLQQIVGIFRKFVSNDYCAVDSYVLLDRLEGFKWTHHSALRARCACVQGE